MDKCTWLLVLVPKFPKGIRTEENKPWHKVCGEDAPFIFNNSSYCQEHIDVLLVHHGKDPKDEDAR